MADTKISQLPTVSSPALSDYLVGDFSNNTYTGRVLISNLVGLLDASIMTPGTVTSVNVASANGFAASITNPTTTPVITLTTSLTGLLKGNGSAMSAAVSGVDYAPATIGASILSGNSAGGFVNVAIGSGLTFAGGTLATTGGTGTVTTVSVVSANGFAGTVATPTTTPAITITTSVTGLLKGNGVGVSAAVSGTDYAPATSGSSILYGNGSGGFSNVTVGSGLSFSAGTLSSTSSGGTVTSVSFTGGIVSVATATTTPALTVAGTSGGIPYFSSGTTWATSAVLAANAIMVGGGAGAAPQTITTGLNVVGALGSAVNTTGGFPTLSVAIGNDNIVLGQGSGFGLKELSPGIGVVTAIGNAVNTTGGLVTVDGTATLTNKTLTNPTVTNYTETLFTANTGTAITVALTNGTVQQLTLTGNATITMPTAAAGKSFIIMLKQDGTGSRTVTWSTVAWPAATAPTITSTASKQDIYSFFSDGTNWYGVTVGQNY